MFDGYHRFYIYFLLINVLNYNNLSRKRTKTDIPLLLIRKVVQPHKKNFCLIKTFKLFF